MKITGPVTIKKDGVELRPLDAAWTVGVDMAESASITVTILPPTLTDAERVRILLAHAEARKLRPVAHWRALSWSVVLQAPGKTSDSIYGRERCDGCP